MPPRKPPPDLVAIVAEMRKLGVTEYQRGDLKIVLSPDEPKEEGTPKLPPPEFPTFDTPDAERAYWLAVPRAPKRPH